MMLYRGFAIYYLNSKLSRKAWGAAMFPRHRQEVRNQERDAGQSHPAKLP